MFFVVLFFKMRSLGHTHVLVLGGALYKAILFYFTALIV